jgi:phage terminase large subunit GpA-like protein
MVDLLDGLTVDELRIRVSEWAEQKRYIPPELTTKPGMWDNNYTPYLVEIMDRLSDDDPARKIVVMKAAQIGATTGILENALGYWIDHSPSGIIYVSATEGMTQMGLQMRVERMLHHSGLGGIFRPPDGGTKRSGDRSKLKEFPGGFLLPVGAHAPGPLRSTAAMRAVLDELDGMPASIGGIGREEGSPVDLVEKRTDTFNTRRKLLYISTPLIMQTSMIYPMYMSGDQRQYKIPCVHCGFMQPLEWHGVHSDGSPYGMVFDLREDGTLVLDSVGYACFECNAIFRDYDKTWFLPKGVWTPYSETEEEGLVSYHIPAFVSPPGMYPWTAIVAKWLKAWDAKNDRPRDRDKLQQFYNLERGLPWEERGESPKFETVQAHRRAVYSEGQIPNEWAIKETGAPIICLTCAVDVQKGRLDVEIVGWCQHRQSYSIVWQHLMGDPDDMTVDGPWGRLSNLIEKEWEADDGRVYRVQTTLIDVGWAEKAASVYEYCQQFSQGVYPVMGRENPIKGARIREFAQGESATGNILFNVTATIYKDRLAGWLKSEWAGTETQPTGYPNYPVDRGDDFFREYEGEEKVQDINRTTKERGRWRWKQIGHRPNHAWDCRVYGTCGFDMIVEEVCREHLELAKMDYEAFARYTAPRRNASGKWEPTLFSFHPLEVGS